MINASGFNVYPSQVEDAVRSMPGVLDVAAVGVPAGESGEDVVAAIVLEAGASVTLADLRKWAEKTLAHYALPRQLVVMTELPRSQLGKVMRKKVREQIMGAQAAATDAVAGAREAVAGAREAVSEAVAEARESMSERVAGARETASEAMAGARDSVAEAVAGVRESSSGPSNVGALETGRLRAERALRGFFAGAGASDSTSAWAPASDAVSPPCARSRST